MRQRYYYVAGFGALILVIVIDICVRLAGPIDASKLRDWQPLMAAMIALCAGTLAYLGALAKVNFDREVRLRRMERKQTGIYMRLAIALHGLKEYMGPLAKSLKRPRFDESARYVAVALNRLEIGIEIEEAWRNLDIFPIAQATQLAQVRVYLGDLARALKDQDSDKQSEELFALEDIVGRLLTSSDVINDWLIGQIDQRRPS